MCAVGFTFCQSFFLCPSQYNVSSHQLSHYFRLHLGRTNAQFVEYIKTQLGIHPFQRFAT